MDVRDLLLEAHGRIAELVRGAVDGLSPEQLRWTPSGSANPVGWLVWHLTRVQYHHVAELLEREQIWESGDWAVHFGLEPVPDNTGYGHRPEDVASVRPSSAQALVDYYDAVAARTREYIG